MGDLSRGSGYQVKVIEAVNLVWNIPEQEDLFRRIPVVSSQSSSSKDTSPVHFVRPAPTGANMSLLIGRITVDSPDDPVQPVEVGVFTLDGLCVGAEVLTGEAPYGTAIWGDDPTTELIDGAVDGEPLTFLVWNSERELDVTANWTMGNGVYGTDGLGIAELRVAGDVTTPTEFRLEKPYPNPFNGSTLIRFSLKKDEDIKLAVYDLSGREVALLTAGRMSSGWHSVVWDAEGIASGVYMVRLICPNDVHTAKVVLIR